MTDITFAVRITSVPNKVDRRTIQHVVDTVNTETETPQYPTGSAAEYVAAYEDILSKKLIDAHRHNIGQARQSVDQEEDFRNLREAWLLATPSQKDSARSALLG